MTEPIENDRRFLRTPHYWVAKDGQMDAYNYLWTCATRGMVMDQERFWSLWERPDPLIDSPCKEEPKSSQTLILDVPYNNQRNNSNTCYDPGDSQCYATSIGMVLQYHGIMSCNEYLKRYPQFGSSTKPKTHQMAMSALPVHAVFRQNGTMDQIMRMIEANKPVPVGWLHRWHVDGPVGGHWSVIIGYDKTSGQWIQHDPYGEALLVSGGWAKRNPITGENGPGKSVRYSFINFHRRANLDASHQVQEGNYWLWDIEPKR